MSTTNKSEWRYSLMYRASLDDLGHEVEKVAFPSSGSQAASLYYTSGFLALNSQVCMQCVDVCVIFSPMGKIHFQFWSHLGTLPIKISELKPLLSSPPQRLTGVRGGKHRCRDKSCKPHKYEQKPIPNNKHPGASILKSTVEVSKTSTAIPLITSCTRHELWRSPWLDKKQAHWWTEEIRPN